ncbi:hypothetical protein, conserved [Babesia bigemina]|uniref:Uncharacterized protein n=1 Tax=Babesia bigemina TaxID=5866 RepID=A0A061D832_BABBI|nr:hypothetical protein, conserved [Babesia bigemina]CDR95084.1 hypothetical protein, conserved [Babesia bigemina]|eukprot:XP_012767270.1 hypothetical protein, conserved [Babesia bigemina]
MELQITGPFNQLSTEDLEVLDDVAQTFCEAVDIVLKTNFKSQKRDASHLDSATRSTAARVEEPTKNQKIAAVFCRQWLAAVLSELTHHLAEAGSDRFNHEAAANIASPRMLEEGADASGTDDIGLCIENARICGNGQIEVNYELDPSQVPQHLKPKLKAQELMQLILQGKQTEQELTQKLEHFWLNVPSLLCQYLDREEDEEARGDDENRDEQPAAADHTDAHEGSDAEAAGDVNNEESQTTQQLQQQQSSEPATAVQAAEEEEMDGQVPFDEEAIELLENIARGFANPLAPEHVPGEDVQQKLAQIAERSKELGVHGMDTYIALYNKVNKEIANVKKMAKFFAKLATDVSRSRGQIDTM